MMDDALDLLDLLIDIVDAVIYTNYWSTPNKSKAKVGRGQTEEERDVIMTVAILLGMCYDDDQKLTKVEKRFIDDFLSVEKYALSNKSKRMIRKMKRKKMDQEMLSRVYLRLGMDERRLGELTERIQSRVRQIDNPSYHLYLERLKKQWCLNH
jgi:hypothetical protein